MTMQRSFSSFTLKLAAIVVLAVGLGCSAWIYVKADRLEQEALSEVRDGSTYYLDHPELTKKYQRELELYGGKVNVLADRFMRWVSSLGEGKNLAYLVGGGATLSAVVCLVLSRSASTRRKDQ
jgi:hypothetical protein